jgi:hypothetical protein
MKLLSMFLLLAERGHKAFSIRQITPKTESGLLVVRFCVYNVIIMNETLQSSLQFLGDQTMQSLSLLLPKILGALTALVVGVILAKLVRGVVKKVLKAINFAGFINKTPLQLAFEGDRIGERIVFTVSNLFYWLTMLVIVHTVVSILGLGSLTVILEKILGYIPNVISAMFIMLFGVLVGGWVEGLVKGAIKTIEPKTGRLLGKISGYFVIALTAMTAFTELGIASEFLTIVFIGFVAMLSLGFGLAIGLGGKDLVGKILNDLYEKQTTMAKEEDKEKSKKK